MKPNKKKKIGIFDSGAGGLIIAKHLATSSLNADYTYVADTAHMPYGNKPHTKIKELSARILTFLLQQQIDLCVIACHTIACIAFQELYRLCPPSVILLGLVEETVLSALSLSKKKHIAVIGTHATIESHAHKNMLQTLDNSVQVVEKACPSLASDIEHYYHNKTLLSEKIEHQLAGIALTGIDCIILACTHYPLVTPLIRTIVGPDITLITGTEHLLSLVQNLTVGEQSNDCVAQIDFFSTGNPQELILKSQALLNWPLREVKRLHW